MDVKLVNNGESTPISDEDIDALQTVVHECIMNDSWQAFDALLLELAVKYGKKETPGMTSIYVVMEAGLEYNDEIYYQEGWQNLGDTAFLTVEEARENAKLRLKALIGGFTLNSFTYEYDADFTPSIKNWVTAMDTSFDVATWGQYIEWAEQNGMEWVTEVPEFVVIREIQVPGQIVGADGAQTETIQKTTIQNVEGDLYV